LLAELDKIQLGSQALRAAQAKLSGGARCEDSSEATLERNKVDAEDQTCVPSS